MKPRQAPPQARLAETPASPPQAVHPSAELAADVALGAFCSIGAGARIGPGTVLRDHVVVGPGAAVGRDCLLHTHVVLYDGVVIGDRCELHSGTAIGADCYGHEDEDEGLVKPPAQGSVTIGNDVEIGVNCSIERGQQGDTRIADGVKIGDLAVVAHDCRIGRRNIICSQVGIAGSTTTGDYVVMAGQVGVRDHVHIGDQAQLGAQAGVSSDVPGGEVYLGSPATPIRQQKVRFAAFAKMPQMRKEFRQLQKEVEELKAQLQTSRDAA